MTSRQRSSCNPAVIWKFVIARDDASDTSPTGSLRKTLSLRKRGSLPMNRDSQRKRCWITFARWSQNDPVHCRLARDELAAIWLDASDRNAVTAAAHIIDVQLAVDAAIKGVDLHEGL